MLPGAQGRPDADAEARSRPTIRPRRRRASGAAAARSLGRRPATYPGGKFHWPVVGGDNYVSQYFHYGHWAIDIAADYGAKVVAAAAGKVIFAGWKTTAAATRSGSPTAPELYTTYNHMSSITVSNAASVGRGPQVGRVGMTGNATGPHLHFEVWRGPVWDGGTRVNPLHYL